MSESQDDFGHDLQLAFDRLLANGTFTLINCLRCGRETVATEDSTLMVCGVCVTEREQWDQMFTSQEAAQELWEEREA